MTDTDYIVVELTEGDIFEILSNGEIELVAEDGTPINVRLIEPCEP